jgi:hypothetical protein
MKAHDPMMRSKTVDEQVARYPRPRHYHLVESGELPHSGFLEEP